MEQTMCYIGVNKDGRAVSAVVDGRIPREDVIEAVVEFLEAGLHIERVTPEEARTRLAAA